LTSGFAGVLSKQAKLGLVFSLELQPRGEEIGSNQLQPMRAGQRTGQTTTTLSRTRDAGKRKKPRGVSARGDQWQACSELAWVEESRGQAGSTPADDACSLSNADAVFGDRSCWQLPSIFSSAPCRRDQGQGGRLAAFTHQPQHTIHTPSTHHPHQPPSWGTGAGHRGWKPRTWGAWEASRCQRRPAPPPHHHRGVGNCLRLPLRTSTCKCCSLVRAPGI
jgi:hypothetical protein